MSAEKLDSGHTSGPASDVPTPVRREKKRVGWIASGSDNSSAEKADALGFSTLSPSVSPKVKTGSVPPGAPDAQELSRALTKVLSDEEAEEKRGRVHSRQQSSDLDVSPNPGVRRPRPALRRNTSYDAPHEKEEADRAEEQVTEWKMRSINDARQRADQLAVSLGSHSAPGSRRNSDEMGASFQRLVGDSETLRRGRPPRPAVVIDDYDDERDHPSGSGDARATTRGLGEHEARQEIRYRAAHQRIPSEDMPLDEQDVAAKLVRSHTRAGSSGLFYSRNLHGHASGSTTPTEYQFQPDYVPQPTKVRGGILSTLLKLYNDEQPGSGGGGSTGSSGRNTPLTATPLVSPRPSPPHSRSSSRTRHPAGSRRSSGLFSLHRSHGSSSSLALTELMKSSNMFAAPGIAGNISNSMADSVKKEEHKPHKRKKSQITITKHIADIIARHRYLLKLCRALMLYGAPTHRLEEYLSMSARVLEIEGQFLYMPSCMIISFDDTATHTAEIKVVRVPQGIDLGRLRDVHNIYKEVVHDKLGVGEATDRLEEVMQRQPKFSKPFRVFMFGVASACVAPFAFQARFIDMPFAFILGALVGFLQLVLAPNNELYAHVFEVSAAVLTSFLARAFGAINGGNTICFSALAQSSIALILPGYMVLCSSLELQTGNIVAGSVRMVHALIYTLFLGYGITIGTSLYGMLDKNAPSETFCREPLHRNWYFLFVPAFALCLCLVNQAKWKQLPVMITMALAGFVVNSYCSSVFNENTEISNMLGALTVGILANLYSRLGRHVENWFLNVVDWFEINVNPRVSRLLRRKNHRSEKWPLPSDTESRPASPTDEKPKGERRQVGYSLAAAAMLPAIFVQVPSGLAVGGSLLAGITSADEITGSKEGGGNAIGSLDGTAFNVLFKVIQVAIGISVGLFMSALIVYPLGKRRSGLFSF